MHLPCISVAGYKWGKANAAVLGMHQLAMPCSWEHAMHFDGQRWCQFDSHTASTSNAYFVPVRKSFQEYHYIYVTRQSEALKILPPAQ